MDYLHHPFLGNSHTVFARKGMVVTSQPLAPQAALDMPRWQWMKGKAIHVEPEYPSYLV